MRIVTYLTASTLTKNKLIKAGIKEVSIVPLGVDPSVFYPQKKQKTDEVVIGSFQKDGNGWGAGLEPKMIKGPDIFCDAVTKLAKECKVFVLLTGPARGYVKKRLKEANIPHAHTYPKDPAKIANLYRILDLYLITSREEGGPLTLLEALASGVPVVTTNVGMVRDIIVDGENGFIAEPYQIAEKAKLIIENPALRTKFIRNGLITARKYSWERMAHNLERIYDKVSEKV